MTLANLTLLVLRLVVGLTFAAHGAQKAFGWWNGPGFAGWRRAMAGMRFQPQALWAAVSIGAELGGGLLLAIGFLTPPVAALLIAQSVVIILKVHLPNGFWNSQRGLEFPLALGAGAVAILGVGPGSLSIDRTIGLAFPEAALWLLLVVGLAAGIGAHLSTHLGEAPRPATEQR